MAISYRAGIDIW